MRCRPLMIPDIAMPAVRRLAERGRPGRERSDGRRYGRLVNGDRGGYLGYATCGSISSSPAAIPPRTRTG